MSPRSPKSNGIKLAVSGCQGRMGQRITALALEDNDFDLTTLLEHQDHPQANQRVNNIQVSANSELLKGCDVLIEFTAPNATIEHLQCCVKHGVRMVIGTTGLTEEQISQIKKAAQKIPIVFSSNMSVGVNLFFKLAGELAGMTPPSYSVRMVEAHHIHKKDAPSGTAKTLAQMVEQNSKHQVTKIDSIREGEIIGDHDVIFESPEDIITIRHHAKSRDIFAKGSLVAAKFLMTKSKGLFTMQQVLDL